MTLDEAAAALRLSRRTLSRRIREGDLRVVRLGPARAGAVRVEPEALAEFVDRHRHPAKETA